MDAESPSPNLAPDNFYIASTAKLVVMSILSFGMYPAYWLYRNWQAMRKSKYKLVIPWLRLLVYPFFAYDCFRWIEKGAEAHDIKPQWNASFLAISFFALTCMSFLDAPYEYIALLNFLPILASNQTALDVRRRTAPAAKAESAYTFMDLLIVVLGVCIFGSIFACSYLLSQVMDPNISTLFGN